jgi:predicted short-subunit dehydrogenase-like oxidoreductase (DUF2520 family)
LQPANIWLIATPDSQIEIAYKQLQASGALDQGAIVFHCSGSIGAAVLNSNNSDIHVASVHPIHSFADPQKSLSHFPDVTVPSRVSLMQLKCYRPCSSL